MTGYLSTAAKVAHTANCASMVAAAKGSIAIALKPENFREISDLLKLIADGECRECHACRKLRLAAPATTEPNEFAITAALCGRGLNHDGVEYTIAKVGDVFVGRELVRRTRAGREYREVNKVKVTLKPIAGGAAKVVSFLADEKVTPTA